MLSGKEGQIQQCLDTLLLFVDRQACLFKVRERHLICSYWSFYSVQVTLNQMEINYENIPNELFSSCFCPAYIRIWGANYITVYVYYFNSSFHSDLAVIIFVFGRLVPPSLVHTPGNIRPYTLFFLELGGIITKICSSRLLENAHCLSLSKKNHSILLKLLVSRFINNNYILKV